MAGKRLLFFTTKKSAFPFFFSGIEKFAFSRKRKSKHLVFIWWKGPVYPASESPIDQEGGCIDCELIPFCPIFFRILEDRDGYCLVKARLLRSNRNSLVDGAVASSLPMLDLSL